MLVFVKRNAIEEWHVGIRQHRAVFTNGYGIKSIVTFVGKETKEVRFFPVSMNVLGASSTRSIERTTGLSLIPAPSVCSQIVEVVVHGRLQGLMLARTQVRTLMLGSTNRTAPNRLASRSQVPPPMAIPESLPSFKDALRSNPW